MLTGSLVAIVTPMKAGGALDLDALKRLCDWHIESGTAGIVVVGTTGESPTSSTSTSIACSSRPSSTTFAGVST